MTRSPCFTKGCEARSALGSLLDVLPKKLSSSTAVSPVWASVDPTMSELVGVDAQLLLELEAVLQRRAGIFEFEHVGRLGDRQVEIALVPALEIGELVIRRQEGMRLAIALDLRHLIESLPLVADFRVLAVDRRIRPRLDHREHSPVRQIAIMGDRKHAAAGLVLIAGHPLPQVAWIVASRRQSGVRNDLTRPVAIVAENDVAVQIVAAGIRGPLIADEGREPARLIGLLRRLDGFLPGPAIGRGIRRVEDRSFELASTECGDDIDGGRRTLAGLHHVVPFASQRIGQKLGLSRQ